MGDVIALISLGCSKNLVISEQMLYLLRESGFTVTGEPDGADAVIVNTCGFIDSAKSEAIDVILELGAAKSEGRIGKIIVAGCLAERYKSEIMSELPEIDVIVGVGGCGKIVDAVNSALRGGVSAVFGEKDKTIEEIPRLLTHSAPWAYVKIADGCDNRCAFCVIPGIRGRFRSRPLENIVAEAKSLIHDGVRELILVAQDVTRYGLDLYGKRSLVRLLHELTALPDLKWLRLHYLYPDEIDDELISIIAENDKILKYLDIPIQHINDTVLRKMGRRGTGTEIRALVSKLRNRIPDAVIRTSIITGLPFEGEEEFSELCEFLQSSKLERAGVFVYSPEEGTPAAEMDRVDTEEAERRAEIVTDIQSQIMDEFNESRIGQVLTVLIDGGSGDGYIRARSFAESPDVDGYINVKSDRSELSGFVNVTITGTLDGELYADLSE